MPRGKARHRFGATEPLLQVETWTRGSATAFACDRSLTRRLVWASAVENVISFQIKVPVPTNPQLFCGPYWLWIWFVATRTFTEIKQ